MFMIITNKMIESLRTPAGGFTRDHFRLLGVSYPPKKGWKHKLIGKEASPELTDVINSRPLPFNPDDNMILNGKEF